MGIPILMIGGWVYFCGNFFQLLLFALSPLYPFILFAWLDSYFVSSQAELMPLDLSGSHD